MKLPFSARLAASNLKKQSRSSLPFMLASVGVVTMQFMIATLTDLVLRVVLAVCLSRTALGAVGIWCAWPIGWTIATCMSIHFYRNGDWNE